MMVEKSRGAAFMLAGAALLTLSLAAGAALAQSQSYQDTGYSAFAEILSAYDTNEDGVLDRGEFAQAPAGDFDEIDLNGDQALDDGELSAWQQRYIDRLAAESEMRNE